MDLGIFEAKDAIVTAKDAIATAAEALAAAREVLDDVAADEDQREVLSEIHMRLIGVLLCLGELARALVAMGSGV